jgi:ABC-2 type transport system ATP-binding protein
VLEVRNVSKRFGPRVAVADLSFDCRAGEAVGLLGRNGAGKTTTMRIILGIIRAESGEIVFDGRRVDERQRRRFGYLPEERGLYPRQRVGEQLVYLARLAGLRAAPARVAAVAVAERLEMADILGRAPEELSRGTAQKAQIAAALVSDPPLLVLDEPFAGLDPINARLLDGVLRESLARGTAVVYSSHQLEQVETLCERVTIIHEGRTVLAGQIDELKASLGRTHVVVEGPDAGAWADAIGGTRTVERSPNRVRLEVAPDDDPNRILALGVEAGRITRFSVEAPTLTELFVGAVGAPPQEPSHAAA